MTYYDEIAEGYNELHKEEQLNKLNVINDYLTKNRLISKKTRLLDVGCGTGLSFGVFKCDVYGIDSSRGLLKQIANKNVKTAQSESIPYPDHYFDIVISVTAMHNFDDIQKGIDEMKRVGKGAFCFSVLKKSGKFSLINGMIESGFNVKDVVDEGKDVVFFANLNGKHKI